MSADINSLLAPNEARQFEQLCQHVLQHRFKTLGGQPYARPGFCQHGVDFYIERPTAGGEKGSAGVEFIGVQCKHKDRALGHTLTVAELNDEVEKAKGFRPPLTAFIVATSAPTAKAVQDRARELTAAHAREVPPRFSVTTWFWEKIRDEFATDEKLRTQILERFYPHLLTADCREDHHRPYMSESSSTQRPRALASQKPPAGASPREFFISYTGADLAWAEWIAWELKEAGHSVVVQALDFGAGANFVLEMDKAARAERTIAVLTPAYEESAFAAPEWAAAFVKDPQGTQRKLVPVRVADYKPGGLLAAIAYIDLFGLDEQAARVQLIQQIEKHTGPPTTKPVFPGTATVKPVFPGFSASPPIAAAAEPSRTLPRAPAASAALKAWQEKLDYLQTQEAIASDATQKFALKKQIEEAQAKVRELGG